MDRGGVGSVGAGPQNQLDPPEDTETLPGGVGRGHQGRPQNQLDPPEDTETEADVSDGSDDFGPSKPTRSTRGY